MLTHRSSILAAAVGALSFLLPAAYGDVTLDVSRATRVVLPAASGDAPVAFTTPDGKEGWVRKLASETIPTPAFAKGRIFTGAGFSSSTFMALDALTGKTIWNQTTIDGGPTSPVVEGDSVNYNTESCDTESRDLDSGYLSWHEITGGTLLVQNTVIDGTVIIPHPTMSRTSKWQDHAFRMLAVDAKDGKHKWDADMTGDVMGAAVAADGRVYFVCTDGRLFTMAVGNGASNWHVVANATSAPVVVGKTLAVTTEEKKITGGATVSIRRYNVDDGELLDKEGLMPVSVGAAVPTKRAEWNYQGPKIAAAG